MKKISSVIRSLFCNHLKCKMVQNLPTRPNGHRWSLVLMVVSVRTSARTYVRTRTSAYMRTKKTNDWLCRWAWWVTKFARLVCTYIYVSYFQHLCFGDVQDCNQKYRLALLNASEMASLNNLYQLFSDKPVLFLDKTKSAEKHLTCFTKALVGLEQDSLWINHGLNGLMQEIRDVDNIRPSSLEEFR